jgi:DNA-directed RNA polymerase beta' subunit
MTRVLTKKEIENLLDFIVPQDGIPLDTAMSVVEANKERFRAQLVGQKVYPSIIPKLKEQMKKSFEDSLVQAGESVGVICAQSIGEKQTQTTLNTFHRAGQSEKTMTSGVPRFQELINATKKPRIVNHKIYFNRGNDSIEELRKTVGHDIVGLCFKDIALSIDICLDKEDESWYEFYKMLYNDSFSKHSNCVSIKLDMDKLFNYRLSMDDIATYIETEYDDLYCVFSSPKVGQIDIFVDVDNMELPEDRICFVDSDNAVEIYLEECVQPVLESMNICGIQGISEIFYTHGNDGVWFCETNGINSRGISSQFINYKNLLALPQIDSCKTISNNVWDIYEVLGIEAAREFLINEFMEIMEGINSCHTLLLVDRMTHGGGISSITRYTMKKDESGPFGRASFEETMDNFLNAAAQGEIEPTKGVSASIICGKRASIGTGMIDLCIDLKRLPKPGGSLKPIPEKVESKKVESKKVESKVKKFNLKKSDFDEI